ncbi:MAG: nuclear transport factor 2 family protein [Nocardioidaceae bacterium]
MRLAHAHEPWQPDVAHAKDQTLASFQSVRGDKTRAGAVALLQRFIDVINAQDLDRALVEIVAENLVELNPLPGQGPGRAGLADVLAMMFAGFPDLRWTLHDTLVESRIIMDIAGLLGQLGVLPAHAAA